MLLSRNISSLFENCVPVGRLAIRSLLIGYHLLITMIFTSFNLGEGSEWVEQQNSPIGYETGEG